MQTMATWQRLIPVGLAVFLMGAGGNGRPALVDAARNANWESVRSLLQESADANASEGDGSTALHWASYHNNTEAAGLLLRAGADANAANDLGVTPLWAAGLNGSAAMARLLLDAGANPNKALLSGETALMVAARSGSVEVVELLLERDADIEARGGRKQTALMWAAAQKHPDIVKVLLGHGADVHARSEVWSQMMAVPPHGYLEYNRMIPHGGDTALLFAARVGDLDSAKLLLDAGADVNETDAWGVSAMVLAAHSGFTDLVEFLLSKGADPNKTDAGFSALQIAVMRRDERMAGALLAKGADPNEPVRNWTPTRRASQDFHFPPALVGATPLWLAARFCEPGLVQMLVKHGANPLFVHRADYRTAITKRHLEATTALMAAVGMGRGSAWIESDSKEHEKQMLETVNLLVDLGVEINAKNSDGRTALDAAKASRYEPVAAFLIEHGAN